MLVPRSQLLRCGPSLNARHVEDGAQDVDVLPGLSGEGLRVQVRLACLIRVPMHLSRRDCVVPAEWQEP